MNNPETMHANQIYARVPGAPYQPGDYVRVVKSPDQGELTAEQLVGRYGLVRYLEYDCGCGQTKPGDPMIGVVLEDGTRGKFRKEELEKVEPHRSHPTWEPTVYDVHVRLGHRELSCKVSARCPASAALEMAEEHGPGCYDVVDEHRRARYRVKMVAEPWFTRKSKKVKRATNR